MKVTKYLIFVIVISNFLFLKSEEITVNGIPQANLPKPPYAEWAHYHWVWLHNSISNQQNVLDMVKQYQDHDIQVGAIDIDSGWSTGFNNFIWNSKKFPNPAELVQQLHSQNIKVIVWATQMIDTDSSNFETAKQNNYMLNNGKTIKWWHGKGGFLDYTNPEARDWWHSQLKQVLDIGIDGWKCDGTDPYIYELILPHGKGGFLDHKEYANLYYGDFFNYTREIRGDVGLIMSRPVDNLIPNKPLRFIYLDFSPKYVMFSGWVGDQDDNFEGLRDALGNMFHSAWQKYTNFGSDIGGYRTPVQRTKQLFLRWAQLGALVPLMENGGGGPHFPWQFDDETVQIYRQFVNIHYELVPFFYTAGSEAYEEGVSVMKPSFHKQFWFTFFKPRYYDYTLWHDIHVTPVTENVTEVTVRFPRGNNWVDYWNSSLIYKGGKKHQYQVPLNRFPIFLRQNSIIPMNVTKQDSLYGSNWNQNYLTFVISHPQINSKSQKGVRQQTNGGIIIDYTYTNEEFSITATQFATPIIIIISGVQKSDLVITDKITGNEYQQLQNKQDLTSAEQGFLYCPCMQRLMIKTSPSNKGWSISIKNLISSNTEKLEE